MQFERWLRSSSDGEEAAMMASSRQGAQFPGDADDDVFDPQALPDAVLSGRVLPPTSASFRLPHRVSARRRGYHSSC